MSYGQGSQFHRIIEIDADKRLFVVDNGQRFVIEVGFPEQEHITRANANFAQIEVGDFYHEGGDWFCKPYGTVYSVTRKQDANEGHYLGEDRINFCLPFIARARQKQNPSAFERRYIAEYEQHLEKMA